MVARCACEANAELLLLPCSLNAFLKSVDVGEYILQGDLEAYSCEGVCIQYSHRPAMLRLCAAQPFES